ncbi:hypothetical protein NC651_029623 [Populus alba x Populus x berolinensis]|nr:hypothetical protein NC651_029623 [Populus alba x Populus x berolinensis]
MFLEATRLVPCVVGLVDYIKLGDTDVGEFIVPIPHVQAIFQMREEDLLSASDGIWDAINLLIWLPRSMMIQHALLLIIIPSDIPVLPPIPRKKHNMFQFAFWKQSDLSSGEQINQKAFCLFGVVEELLSKYFPANTNSGLCRCAVCQVDQTPGDSLSVNSCSFFSLDQSHGKAPSSAVTVRKKKDAMEGKRSSRPTLLLRIHFEIYSLVRYLLIQCNRTTSYMQERFIAAASTDMDTWFRAMGLILWLEWFFFRHPSKGL